MPDVFGKRRAGVHPDFYPAEAAGLRWLADGGAPVVAVVDVDSRHIDLERLDEARPSASAASEFGPRLAGVHSAGAAGFGAPPDGFTGQLFIGNRPMSSTVHDTWGEFYAAERVQPFVRAGVDAGNITRAQLPDIEAACELVASGVFDDDEPPARLHGDLWSGNVMWTPSGVVLIDPAAHGGHRETDLAMLALFGCPYLAEIRTAYDEARPLRDGWRERVPVHQLHPLAVHAAGHGPSYGHALQQAASATLRI